MLRPISGRATSIRDRRPANRGHGTSNVNWSRWQFSENIRIVLNVTCIYICRFSAVKTHPVVSQAHPSSNLLVQT